MDRRSTRAFAAVVLALAVALAMGLSPLASPSPDGLERVAADTGFAAGERTHAVQRSAPAPDYAFPGIGDARLATAVSGFVGTLAVFAAAHGLALVLRRRRRPASP